MLGEYEAYIAKQNGLDADEIADLDATTMLVTFKNGEHHRLAECYTRVMGYIRPLTDFNIGKKGEHATRKPFTEVQAMKHVTLVAE